MPSLFPNAPLQIPAFTSLLVVGQYHASAPIHLALSHIDERPDSHPVIISPSRQSLKDALRILNDDWISSKARRGNMLEAISRIDLLYPPSPVHLSMALAMLRYHRQSDTDLSDSWLNPKATRVFPPRLIILHEPSYYFDDDELSTYTVSSYTALVVRAFGVIRSLAEGPTCSTAFALFDSKLMDLKLPLTRNPSAGPYQHQTRNDEDREAVFPLAEKYFEWVANFEPGEDEETVPSSQHEDEDNGEVHCPKKQMTLYRVKTAEQTQVYHWEEVIQTNPDDLPPTTHYKF